MRQSAPCGSHDTIRVIIRRTDEDVRDVRELLLVGRSHGRLLESDSPEEPKQSGEQSRRFEL